jgi:hypothetical protein
VLIIGHLAESRSEAGWFTSREVADLFEALRVPAPAIAQALSRLGQAALVIKERSRNRWALTPRGRERVIELIGAVDPDAIAAELAVVSSADLSQARHPLIPPELAPVRWAVPIQNLLERFPFDGNVFLMTRFPKDEKETGLPDPVRAVIHAAREALSHHGLVLHLASDRNADDELFGNIAGHMWACKYGVGLFETASARSSTTTSRSRSAPCS